jgi:uncharacterized protein YbjT (DUF2867 family)
MTILVTGATGNIGAQVIQHLVNHGADVRALVRDPSKANFPAGVAVVKGDLLDVDSLRSAFDGVSTLFLLNAAGLVRDWCGHRPALRPGDASHAAKQYDGREQSSLRERHRRDRGLRTSVTDVFAVALI